MESHSPDFSSSEEEHVVADDEDLVKSSDDLEDSKESGVSSTSAWPRFCKYFKNKLFFIVRLESLRSAISCASAERDDSRGCTANVKETPPSPKEKPEDLIGADIDSVRDDEDWAKSSYSLMAKGSMESIDSGVSFKSDWSRSGLINFKDSSSLSRSGLSLLSMNSVAHHKDLFKSSDDLMPRRRTQFDPVTSNFLIPLSQQSPVVMATRSFEAFGSSLSSMNDSVIRNRQLFLPRMVLRSMDAFGSSLSMISDSFVGTGQRSPPRMAKGSMESIDSGVSFKSDWSRSGLINFKDSSSLREGMNQELSSEVGLEHG